MILSSSEFFFSLSLCLYKEINLEFTVVTTLFYSQYENTVFRHNMKRYKIVLEIPKQEIKIPPKLDLEQD